MSLCLLSSTLRRPPGSVPALVGISFVSTDFHVVNHMPRLKHVLLLPKGVYADESLKLLCFAAL
jgi:hypothetical protein